MANLPYPARPGQEDLLSAIEGAQAAGRHLVVEAGTGTGKTVTALAASLATARPDGRRVVYATRTNSQQAQVVREHKALLDIGEDAGLLVPFMGRRHYCPLLRTDPRFRDGTAEELGRLCRDAKRKAVQAHATGAAVEGACPFYSRLLRDGTGPVEALLGSGGLDGADLAARVESAGSCPYEALKLLMPKARTVVVPYVFLLDDGLRMRLFQWIGVGADECHLVLDEAHHLPDAAREHHSLRLTFESLRRSQKEAEEWKDPLLARAILSSGLVDALLRALASLRAEFVRDGEDGLVPPGALEEALLMALRVPSPTLLRAAADLERLGESIREDRRAKGRLPRSYLGNLGAFLRNWWENRDAPYVHLVLGGDNPALEMYLLDPAPTLAWMGEAWSTLHMSGTLAPLAEHAELCGLDPARTECRCFESPFDSGHLEVWGLAGVTRRFETVERDPTIVARQQEAARRLLAAWPGKTGLFFPSHALLRDYLEEGLLHGLGRPVFVETPELDGPGLLRLVRDFKAAPAGALLVGVLGGRLAEGLDFPGDELENALLFAVPYPRPSARSQALIHHYDAKTGRGWQVAVHGPVARTMRQAIGRLIRGPEDRGRAVVLDERAVRFRDQIPRLRMADGVEEILRGPSWEPEGYQTAAAWARNTETTLSREPPGRL